MIDHLVSHWIKKAESDLKVAKDELRTEEPAFDMVCFHAQQGVEKYLKAYLTFNQKPFRKTHDIQELVVLCCESDQDFKILQQINAGKLTIYGTEIRYPDDYYLPTSKETKEAILIADQVKVFVWDKLEKAGYHPA